MHRSLKTQKSFSSSEHTTVLLAETLKFLNSENAGVFVDATLGAGGHAEGLLEANLHNQVIGIDQDPIAINLAKDRLKPFGKRFSAINSNFREIHELLKAPVDGIVADIGVSSMQLEDPKRGFSFRLDAPLDMRMNPASGTKTAADLLAELREEEIANMIFEYGEERLSRRIARLIVAKRELGEPIKTTAELAELVERAVRSKVRDKIHPATKTFQALRIAVNDELNALKIFLDGAVEMLKPKGRLVVITFHSLEDRIVKRRFEKFSGRCSCPPRIPVCICGAKKIVNVLTKRPVRPMEEELARNPRSRSAKLRACEKLSLS
jgi:16S rRNA (cytosine1402-N4)-methyltransferase